MCFEEVLIDAIVGPEQFERCFEPFCGYVDIAMGKTLVIDSMEPQDNSHGSGFGDEAHIVNKTEDTAMLSQRSGLFVIAEKRFDVKHGGLSGL